MFIQEPQRCSHNGLRVPELFPAFHVVLSARLPAWSGAPWRSRQSSRDAFLVVVSSEKWGWGEDTNKSGSTHNFFFLWNPYLLETLFTPACPLQIVLQRELAISLVLSCPVQAGSGYTTVQLITVLPSFPCIVFGHIMSCSRWEASELYPFAIAVRLARRGVH